jgi:membrane protein implicated in regulation of membrane protease activity
MIGQAARVVEGFSPDGRGRILLHGEYWDAEGPPGLAPGEDARVVGMEGLRLRVERRN